MLILRSFKSTNFRILRDVTLEFSVDEEMPLTVIRAENGTGKTTFLNALTWGLFGDEGLPWSKKRRLQYRLHPLDWDPQVEGGEVIITVEIGISIVDDETGIPAHYDIIRSQTEYIDPDDRNKFTVSPLSVTVMKRSSRGSIPEQEPEVFLKRDILPPALKDVFFVNGDEALKFIDTNEVADRRERVEDAIRKLLGLEILENAQVHLDNTRRDLVRNIKSTNSGTPLGTLAEKEEQAIASVATLQNELAATLEDLEGLVEREHAASDERDAILASGGGARGELKNERVTVKQQIAARESDLDKLFSDLREKLNTSDVLALIAQDRLKFAEEKFQDLETKKIIPNTLPDIVADTLRKSICICGADVSKGTLGHKHLSNILKSVSEQSAANTTLISLAQGVRNALRHVDAGAMSWHTLTINTQRQILESRRNIDTLEKRLGALDMKIQEIPESNLQAVLEKIERQKGERNELQRKRGRIETEIRQAQRELESARSERIALQAKEIKFRRVRAEEKAATDLLQVVEKTIASLKIETLELVSEEMNQIFMNMIVNSPEGENEGKLIQRAILSRDFEISVLGPKGVVLNPDTDLSGAQKRALTMAFILALIKVSGTGAASVIDTPLGMTSGALRHSFLKYTVSNSKQLVLFLTQSETQGVEDILKVATGRFYTMSNSSHYPDQLANSPKSDHLQVMVCQCSYKQACEVCERKAY